MRSFADPAFFRLLNALVSEAGADLRRTRWSHRGVDWVRQRHSFTSDAASFTIEQCVMASPGSHGWSLLLVKEMWWDGEDNSIRSTQWAKPLSGRRAMMLAWLQAEERRLNGVSVTTKASV